jgi:hypothetical protein
VVTNRPDLVLSGEWRNQLGSMLSLRAASDGRLTGWIESKVGGVEGRYPISGFFEAGEDGEGTVGFVVAWSPAGSVTSWSGQYDARSGTITAMWLLTEGGEPVNEWQATRIGADTFLRQVCDPA